MLNTQAFAVLAGNPEPWDRELRERCHSAGGLYDCDDLCAVQEEHHRRGFRSARLVSTLRGWSVRLDGLDHWLILFGSRYEAPLSLEEAIAKGKAWANEDPDKREFIASKRDLAQHFDSHHMKETRAHG